MPEVTAADLPFILADGNCAVPACWIHEEIPMCKCNLPWASPAALTDIPAFFRMAGRWYSFSRSFSANPVYPRIQGILLSRTSSCSTMMIFVSQLCLSICLAWWYMWAYCTALLFFFSFFSCTQCPLNFSPWLLWEVFPRAMSPSVDATLTLLLRRL